VDPVIEPSRFPCLETCELVVVFFVASLKETFRV